jgi:ataxin-3
MDPSQVWIYHERQRALLCGQHALNNLAQNNVFSAGELADIAHDLDKLEMDVWAQNNEGGVNSKEFQQRLIEGSSNVDAQGNFSIEVLKEAMHRRYGIRLPHLSAQDLLSGRDITDMQGFLCHKSDHWFAIRLIGDRFWNLNSMLEIPVVVSHFKLATEMSKWKDEGYTIFCVPSGLPIAGVKLGSDASWHCMADLLQGRATSDASRKNAWENVGSGMRLDGQVTSRSIEDLTEEEQLQLALADSLNPTMLNPVSRETHSIPVPEEPPAGTPGAARIQFRLPDGKRVVRRFNATDSVACIYAFVEQECGGSAVDLKGGYPLKDLASLLTLTIADAKLAGGNIQASIK